MLRYTGGADRAGDEWQPSVASSTATSAAGSERSRWRATAALPLISLLPVVAFAVATMAYLAHVQQRFLEREILQVARHASRATDLLLEERLATLDVLGSLAVEQDLEGFAAHARRILRARFDWQAIELATADGPPLVRELRQGFAAPTPTVAISEPAKGEPVAVVEGAAGRRPLLLLRKAVGGQREDELLVRAWLDLAPFSSTVADLAAPEWTVAALDARNRIAGRSRTPERFVGEAATPSLAREIEAARERFFYAFNQEGNRVYTAFSTSPVTGWTAAIGAPARLVEAPLQRARWAWIGGGIAALALTGLLAWLLTRNALARQSAERRAWKLDSERQSEARLSEIARHFPGVMYRRILHPDGRISFPYLSQGISELLGEDITEDLAQAKSLDDLVGAHVVAEDQPALLEAMRKSAEELTPYSAEARIRRPDGQSRWVRTTASTRIGDNGAIIWDGVMLDITALKATERALQAQSDVLRKLNRINVQIASELDRDNLVQSVLDAGREAITAKFGAFFYNVKNEEGEAFTLYKLSGAKPEDFAGMPMPRNTAVFGPTFRGEGTIRLHDVLQDPRYGRNAPYSGMPKGHLPVRSYLATPVVSRTGEVLGGLFFGHPEPGVFDEAAEEMVIGLAAQAAVALENARLFQSAEDELGHRRKVEEQQKLLLAELNHRVKNTLAVVLAIAQQTARSSHSTEHFHEVYSGRIMALAKAHTLLTAGEWRSTSLDALVETALEPYVDPDGPRASVAGGTVVVPPKQALALSLVLHELATNASKYGALSPGRGRLEVTWHEAQYGMLRLTWSERTEAAVTGPEREGFGSKLIATTVSRELRGSVSREYAQSGLVVEILLPWDAASSELVLPQASVQAVPASGASHA